MKILSEKPRAYNMTVKLEDSERDRLKSLAVAKKRTPHYLMKEAISTYLEREEVEQRFMEAARDAKKHYQDTGLHITHEEFSSWVDSLSNNPNTKAPVCHI